MSYPSDRLGFILPGMPRLSKVEAKGRVIPRKRKAGRQASQIINPAARHHDTLPAGIRKPLKKIPGKRSIGTGGEGDKGSDPLSPFLRSLDLFSLRSCHSKKMIMDLANSGNVSSNRFRQLSRCVGRNIAA